MSKARSAARRVRRRIGRWASPGIHAELRDTKRALKAERKELRRVRRRLPAEQPLPPAVEDVIARARAEHLTYLKPEHLRRLASVVLDAERRQLPGLIVEAGTARGGSAIVMATAKSRGRPMKVYDVFGMIPPPTERDGSDVHERYARIAAGEAKGVGGETYYGYRDDLYDEVTESFRRLGVPVTEHAVELVRGLFEDTIALDEPVAVAHLDGDWYESTLTCLERIAPLVVPGGRIVLDDYYKWSGCRRAVDEYFADHDGFRLEHGPRLHVVREAARRAARPARPRAQPLPRALERGRPLDEAVLAGVRALVRDGEPDRAQSIALSLRMNDDTRELGRIAAGIVAHRRGYPALAWEELRELAPERWSRLAAAEYARAGLAVAPDEALAAIRALAAAGPRDVAAKSWYDLLGPVFGYGAHDLARELYAIFERRVGVDEPPWAEGEALRDWMEPWLAADPGSPPAPPPPDGRRVFAIMDYGHPSARKASANIGDHIQSIAALGHLVRHEGVRFHGAPELVDLLTDLQGRTRPERRRADVDADVEVIAVHRDASTYGPIPPQSWVLCFGWYMHALFGMRHDFPLHRGLRPLFVSFHCNKRQLLTPAAVEYLRRHGPVGCRDWTTVHLLSSLDVPAFFSGCLTATIDTVFADLESAPDADAPVAAVDIPAAGAPEGSVAYAHSSPAVRRRSFTENVRVALDMLETYRGRHRAVVTSRLHCYLPVRSLGVPVEFRPANHADIRYDGLADIGDDAFDAIRDGLNAKLEPVVAAILGGRSEEEVYSLWRELTAADVAAAEERRLRRPLLPPPADVAERVERVRSRVGTAGADGAIEVAVVLDEPHDASLDVLTASLLEHASRPLRLWVLAATGTEALEARLRSRFAKLDLVWVPLRGLARGLRTPAGERRRAAEVARALLGDLLPEVGRLVVLEVPAIATADVAELAGLDLGGHAFAAPLRPGAQASGFGVIHAAAARLDRRTAAAAELRRAAHARHRFDFDAFTDDVLVCDLDRWRGDRLGAHGVALMEAFGLTALEALHVLAGPERATVPARWALVPTRMPYEGPGLVRWADAVMPWEAELTPERERWRSVLAALEREPADQV